MRARRGFAASLAAIALALIALPATALAAVDAFLSIDGIKGESMDTNHTDWIEIVSFSFGASNPTSVGSATGGAGAGKVKFNEFTIRKTTDLASPLLFRAATTGQHFKKVTLEARKAGGDPNTYLVYVLQDVVVTKAESAGGGGDHPTESVTFNFASMRQSEVTESPARVTTTAPTSAPKSELAPAGH
jgi:type VI secretion system secreted protein Hcp